ncbi:major facilitator superfamily protein, partial [Salmonella enterica subsp. enterica serovar Agona str. 400095 18]
PRLLLIYAVTALGYGGVFTAFTFLAPMMQGSGGILPGSGKLDLTGVWRISGYRQYLGR